MLNMPSLLFGAIAQLGERNTGSVEVGGSIPPGSTKRKAVVSPHALFASRHVRFDIG
jgi:hypothetical protein